MERIKWLNSPEADSKAEIGDKAYHLSRLIRSDLSAPESFAVTFSSYQSFLEHNNLYQDLKKILASIDDFSYSELEDISHQAQEAILNGQFKQESEEKILEAYGKIGLTEEVRNAGESAVDLIRGQKETQDVALRPTTNNRLLNKVLNAELNVSGKNTLLKSIKKCYASLFSVPSLYMLETTELDFSSVKISVIVQRMVDANKSGTAYSKNPVSGDNSEYVIESLWGLGSALKTGESSPDIYVINKDSNELKDTYVPTKETEVVRDSYSGSTKVRRLNPKKRDGRLLNNSELNEVISKLMEVERIIGPVKLSFAVERNKLRLLSVRKLKKSQKNAGSEVRDLELGDKEREVIDQGTGIAAGRSSGKIKQVGSPREASREEGGLLRINKCLNDFLPVINNFDGFIANKGSISSSLAELAREIGIPGIIGINYPLYSDSGDESQQLHQNPDYVVMDGTSGRIYTGVGSRQEQKQSRTPFTASSKSNYITACKLQVSEPEYVEQAEGAVILDSARGVEGEKLQELADNYPVVWVVEAGADKDHTRGREKQYGYEQSSGLPGYPGENETAAADESIRDRPEVKSLHEISSMQANSKQEEELEGILVRDFPSLMELEDYHAQYLLLDLDSLRQNVGDERSSAVAKSISLVASNAKTEGAESAVKVTGLDDEIIKQVVAEGIDTLVVPPQQLNNVERKLATEEKRFILAKLRSLTEES